jgi:endonuclease-8
VPEGDTVWLAGQHLHEALAGQVVVRSDFRVPDLATVDLAGRSVLEVVSRGKHLLFRFGADGTQPPVSLHTHFRMDGTWHLYGAGERWGGGPDHQVRVVLEVPGRVAVGYRLPVVELLPTTEESRAVGHLGPDLLAAEWDRLAHDEAVRRLAADPDREIGVALLDQRNLAGLGNLYRLEVLFLRGVNPWRFVRDVDLPPMVSLARRLLMANRARVRQVTTGDTRRGETTYVFERTGRPCRRCGTPIAMATQGEPPWERLTYWCPTCQPAAPILT